MRSEAEKWKVPESDPAGMGLNDRVGIPRPQGMGGIEDTDRGPLIFCGMCGALNPSTNFYCAACGTTLVDAFHATEGLRVFERPDAASRIIEIVPGGTELDINDDPDAPDDYIRIRLRNGRLGYIRLNEVAALERADPHLLDPDTPDPNVHARGCVSPFGALAALGLLIVLGGLAVYLTMQGDSGQGQFLAFITCVIIAPIALLMIFLYLMARDREDQRLADIEDAAKES
ncbi:MAG: hypothetical protein M9947_03290 [Thermomicrobiales bacterium]|nr:hypothetical protein [Thermomicrobiales bacterium]